MGDIAGAESLYRQSLAIRRKVLDPKHPDIGKALNKLGNIWRQQGRYEEAAASLREALENVRPALGNDNPATADCMANLARVYLAQGRAAAAEPLVRHAVEIRRRVLHEGNWQIASAQSLLGAVLVALGRPAEAEPLLLGARRALKDIPGAQRNEARVNEERLAALRQGRHPLSVAYGDTRSQR
jgi:tetratricopeptide (TPR) repeat protein